MTETPVFVIVNLIVADAAEYRIYEKSTFAIGKRFGGEFITYDDAPVTFEGSTPPQGRIILFKFPSETHAKSWYADPEYQALAKHRRAGTQLQFLTVVHGLPAGV